MTPDEELAELYNAPKFLLNYGKDRRKELIEYFDTLETKLAIEKFKWFLETDKIPKEIALKSMIKFLRSSHLSEAQIDIKVKEMIQRQMIKDAQVGIPPEPTVIN